MAVANPNSPTEETNTENPPLQSQSPDPIISESPTAPEEGIVYGEAIVTAGIVDYQIKGQAPASAKVNEEVPIRSDVRIWNEDSIVKMKLEDGSAVMLAPFTTISLVNEQSTSSHTMVSLESGSVLVVAENFWIISSDHEFRIWARGAIVGVRSDPSLETFAVNCFGPQGSCLFHSMGDSTELTPGQQLEYKANIRGEVKGADLEAWRVFFGDILPTPTATPTPTMPPTSTPTPTPTLTPTVKVSGTPTINGTKSPDGERNKTNQNPCDDDGGCGG